MDPHLYQLSRDYVGDTAETVALAWPESVGAVAAGDAGTQLRLGQVVDQLREAGRAELPVLLAAWLDGLDTTGRWALLKLLTGGLRVGVSARLARTAVAAGFGRDVSEVEEIWHGLVPPYLELFQWLEGRAAAPEVRGAPVYRPVMLAHPLQAGDLDVIDPVEFIAEWKWDGIRVQIAIGRGETRLYSRSGDDIGAAFPDAILHFARDAVLDGELLVVRSGVVAPFNDLQQRLNRRAPTRKLIEAHPAHIRLYDALFLGAEDLRPLPLEERRARLAAWLAERPIPHADLSATLAFADRAALEAMWQGTRDAGSEGLMLKRRASPYLAGRPKGHWWKWKRAPLTADCVLMYAQRGAGKRSSYYSDYTFGAWQETPVAGGEAEAAPPGATAARVLVPVGKAYSGFTDAELTELDRWIREHSTERFGPVRAVAPGLVLEVAFDAIQRSPRHKSGIAMRFPRIHRIRWDKPAAEADTVARLLALV